jgi:Zn-dependent protease/predicted transcriptional regulator
MKWSLKLGKILGIDVYIHFTFLLLLGFVGLAAWLPERNLAAALSGVGFFVALFGCVLLHEYGHALTARAYGIKTSDITLLPIGGLARLERMPDKPIQELWVALAGPAVNVVIAAIIGIWLTITGTWPDLTSLTSGGVGFLERLLVVNVFLVLFNLLPAFPMDGGRVLRSLLAMRLEYARATRIAATIGQGMAFLFGFAGLFGNPMLLFIALFVWIGASQEAAQAEMKSSLSGYRVRDAMLTEFRELAPETRLGDVARMILAGSQQDFPVLRDGQLEGLLRHAAFFKALSERGENETVSAIMQTELHPLEPWQDLETALSQVRSEAGLTLPVVEDGRLVGLLTPENVGEFIMIRSALGRRHRPPPVEPPVIGLPPVIRHYPARG